MLFEKITKLHIFYKGIKWSKIRLKWYDPNILIILSAWTETGEIINEIDYIPFLHDSYKFFLVINTQKKIVFENLE